MSSSTLALAVGLAVIPALAAAFAVDANQLAGGDHPPKPITDDPAKPPAPAEPVDWAKVNLHTLESKTLDGKQLHLSEYVGKVLLIVNVASECGYTRQYADLQALYKRFADKGLVVIGVPSNEFGNQEPGTPEEIRDFCTSRFGVTFPLLAKAHVKPGEEQDRVFRALVARTGEAPKWNFTKYLVARDGVRASVHASAVDPSSEEFIETIERLLAEPAPAAAEKKRESQSQSQTQSRESSSTERTESKRAEERSPR